MGRRGYSSANIIPGRNLLVFLLVFSLSLNGVAAATQGGEAVGAAIVGRVSSVDGPLGGLTVVLNELQGGAYVRVSDTTTGPDGGYEFGNLTLGGKFLVELMYGGVYHLKPVTAEDEAVEADFNLTGTVAVTVVDEDGAGVPGLEIRLINKLGYNVANSTTDLDGAGGFSHLDVEEPYIVAFTLQGIPYSNVFRFKNSTSARVDFRLLSATTSDEEIEAYMHHLIVDVEDGHLKVLEAITYRNMGDEVFNNSWLRVWLPPEAVDLSTEIMDCCLQVTEEGIRFDPMEPIFPGEQYETSLSYRLKIRSSSLVLQKKIHYDTETLYIFIKKTSGIKAENVTGLKYEGERTLGGQGYLIFKGSGLQRGSMAVVKLRGLMSITDIIMSTPILWAAILLAAPSTFLLYYLKVQRAGEVEEPAEERPKPPRTPLVPGPEAPRREGPDAVHEAEIGDQLTPEEIADLRAEERAFEAILERIASDHERGQLSERAFERLISRYEGRLKRARERLERSGGAGGESSKEG